MYGKRKGVSVLLLVQQKIFGMHCTFHIALHCTLSAVGIAPDNSQLNMEKFSDSPQWVELEMEDGIIWVTVNH